jgi:hypothetical protein
MPASAPVFGLPEAAHAPAKFLPMPIGRAIRRVRSAGTVITIEEAIGEAAGGDNALVTRSCANSGGC